jgi:hypothetical protein
MASGLHLGWTRFGAVVPRTGSIAFLPREPKMQLILLVGSIVLSVGAALGTASLFLSLLLRIMSKLR